MSYILGIVSQKGGVGKSTLARLFAVELAKAGFLVKIADLDTQQTTSTDWSSDRYENSVKPDIQVQPFGNLKTAINEAKNFDILGD
jgi:chromosome partitioning protein